MPQPANGKQEVAPRLAPVKVLASLFRRRFPGEVDRAREQGQLKFHGCAAPLAVFPGQIDVLLVRGEAGVRYHGACAQARATKPIIRQVPDMEKFNREAALPCQLRLEDFGLVMQDVYDFFFDVNTHLGAKGIKRLDEMLRPAAMSRG